MKTASLINLALPLGLTIAAAIPVLAGDAIDIAGQSETARMLLFVWIALTVATCMAALVFWRTRVEPLIDPRAPQRGTAAQLTQQLIITWALIESSSLLGVVIFLLDGTFWVAAVAVLISWTVAIMTRPQPEWFERLERASD